MRKLASLLFITTILYGCSDEKIDIDPDNLLIGTWNYSEYLGNSSIYLRSNSFIDEHCYRFNADGTLLERKNAGWCGTPPVTYADYAGTWRIINDTLIRIDVAYWGGNTRYNLDIESVDEDSLSIIQLPVSDLEDPE
jgi:hypothetical protein